MIHRHLKYKWAILTFMTVLLIFLGLFDIAVISGLKKTLLQNTRQQAQRELVLMGASVRESLLRNDFVAAQDLIGQWVKEHEDVVHFRAEASNGFLLVNYGQQDGRKHSGEFTYTVKYNGRTLMDLSMAKDFSRGVEALNTLRWKLSSRAVLLTVLMGIALWAAFRTLALIPLEKEVAGRRKAEEKFRNLLEIAPDGMALVDKDGVITLANAQMEEMFGYARSELIGGRVEMLIRETFREKHRHYLKTYFKNYRTQPMSTGMEIHGLAKNGLEFPADINLSPLETEEGMFVLIDVRDISQGKEMEKALRESEEKYRELVEGTDNLITQVNEKGEFTFINHQAEKILGYKPEECLGRSAFDFVHPEDREKSLQAFRSWISRNRSSVTFENRQISRNGDVHHLLWTINLHYDRQGSPLVINSIARDITERKKSEEKVKRSYQFQVSVNEILKVSMEQIPLYEQLEKILDRILSVPSLALESKGCIYLVEEEPDMLIMKARHGFGEEALKACSRVPFGTCSCGRAASRNIVLYEDCLTENHEHCRTGMSPHGHYCVPISSGDRVYGIINLVLRKGHARDQEEERFLSSVANTLAGAIERYQTSREKEKLQEQLIESEKLSALGRMTANVAHEIRNPLTAVGGIAKRLDRRILPEAIEKKYTQTIVAEAGKLEKILRRVDSFILDLPVREEETDLNRLCRETLANYTDLCRQLNIDLRTSYASLPLLHLDRKQITEVMDNIITNAVDSMMEGGRLTFTSRFEKDGGRPVYVVVEISDTGEGIPEDKLDLVFEPFYTTKAVGKRHAVGLGLSISSKFMNRHDGFIRAESRDGRGSTFSLFFPV